MNENQERNNFLDDEHNPAQCIDLKSREVEDRRSKPSEGFAYISTVGLIDRRERIRRTDDPFDF